METTNIRSGFVALIGRPNSGKSTILNCLVQEKIAIVSERPQTTRNRIRGIRTTATTQIVFVDTPGVHRPQYRLNKRMMEDVYASLKEVDLVVQVVDMSVKFGKGEKFVLSLVRESGKPLILALNKIDLVNKGKALPVIDFYSRQFEYREIIPISALAGENMELLEEKIVESLPEGEFIYPHDYVTDQKENFMIAELIREKVLRETHQELPYSTAIMVEEFDESRREKGFVRITASIIVDKGSQKKIVIGRGGRMIKRIGSSARQDIQSLLRVRKMYLELNVKVVEGWRNQENLLNELGASLAITDLPAVGK